VQCGNHRSNRAGNHLSYLCVRAAALDRLAEFSLNTSMESRLECLLFLPTYTKYHHLPWSSSARVSAVHWSLGTFGDRLVHAPEVTRPTTKKKSVGKAETARRMKCPRTRGLFSKNCTIVTGTGGGGSCHILYYSFRGFNPHPTRCPGWTMRHPHRAL
jgi:hypothetical protein